MKTLCTQSPLTRQFFYSKENDKEGKRSVRETENEFILFSRHLALPNKL